MRSPRHELARRTATPTMQRRQTSSASPSFDIDGYIQSMTRPLERPEPTGHDAPKQNSISEGKAPPSEATLSAASIDQLMEHLDTLRGRSTPWKFVESSVDRRKRIIHIVRHLVVTRKQRLTSFMYECIAETLGDPESSSITLVALIKDMAEQSVEPTQEFYGIVLEALMVHPNYVAMLEILDQMRARDWTASKQTLAVALLRDEQYELAYDTLMDLHASATRVDAWVYDIFVLVFGKMGFTDEMASLLAARLSLGDDSMTDAGLDALQFYVFDLCSAAFHYPGTLAGWNTLVRSGKVNPPDGVVENVLNTAAREADTALASEALNMLAHRTKIQDYHYDSLIDAFLLDGDLASAARLHCIMYTNGIPVAKAAAKRLVAAAGGIADGGRQLHEALLRAPDEAMLAPPKLVNAAMAAHAAASEHDLAMDLYDRYDEVCGDKWPPLEVMLQLLPHCEDVATTTELCDRLLLEFDAQTEEGPRAMILDKFQTVIAKMAQAGKEKGGRLFSDKIEKMTQKPRLEHSTPAESS